MHGQGEGWCFFFLGPRQLQSWVWFVVVVRLPLSLGQSSTGGGTAEWMDGGVVVLAGEKVDVGVALSGASFVK